MKKATQYSDSELKHIASFIMRHYYKPYTYSKKTIFLCGKGIESQDSKRKVIEKVIRQGTRKDKYDLVIPEKLFGSLYKGSNSFDLESMELELAKSVDYIIIVLESEGSRAELIAFMQYENLIGKIICILFDKSKTGKSYFDLGPLKRFRKTTNNFLGFKSKTPKEKMEARIFEKIDKIKLKGRKNYSFNAFLSENFLLPAIYLLEPLSLRDVTKLFEYAGKSKNPKMDANIAVITMKSRKLISLTNRGLTFSDDGFNYFMDYKSGRKKNFDKLNQFRVELLNRQNRNKKIKMG